MKPSEVLYSVHEFLLDCQLRKCAKALKKEAELDDNSSVTRIPLFEAVEVWLAQKQQESKKEEQSNEEEERTSSPKKKKKKNESHEEKKKKKKRKRDEEDKVQEEEDDQAKEEDKISAAVKAAEEWMTKASASPTPTKTNSAKEREPGKPFSRVNDEEWLQVIHDEKLKDNTYAGTYGDAGYGHKASQKLVQVRGKQFRHEKTKKKRGSYRGGTIDLKSNSIKFE